MGAAKKPWLVCVAVLLWLALFYPNLSLTPELSWHNLGRETQLNYCDWPAWQEGYSTECNHNVWYQRELYRTSLRVPSALVDAFAGRRISTLIALLLHTGCALLLGLQLKKKTGNTTASLLGASLLLAHPAAAEIVASGTFNELTYALFFFALALSIFATRPAIALALATCAGLCDYSFFVAPIALVLLEYLGRRRPPLLLFASALSLALVAIHSVHRLFYTSYHLTFEPTWIPTFDQRLEAGLGELYFAVWRVSGLWTADSGPWFSGAPNQSFSGLFPLSSVAIGLIAVVGLGVYLTARRLHCKKIVYYTLLICGLFMADACIKAAFSDIAPGRWSGVRQTYALSFILITVVFVHVFPRLRPSRQKWFLLGSLLLGAWWSHLSGDITEINRNSQNWLRSEINGFAAKVSTIDDEEHVFVLESRHEVAITFAQTLWRRRRPAQKVFQITPYGGQGTTYVWRSQRILEIQLCDTCVNFLSNSTLPESMRLIPKAEYMDAYWRRGARLNFRPIWQYNLDVMDRWRTVPGAPMTRIMRVDERTLLLELPANRNVGIYLDQGSRFTRLAPPKVPDAHASTPRKGVCDFRPLPLSTLAASVVVSGD